jgi:prevent-host-death family protein
MVMQRVAAAKFKAQCLSLLDRLDAEGLVITKHGKPIARVLPIARSSAELIRVLRGKIAVCGNLVTSGVKWDAGD